MSFLDEIKIAEDPMQLVPLRSSPDLQALVACWEGIELRIEVKKMAELKTLSGLWNHCHFSFEDACLASGIDFMKFPKVLEQAKYNKLIYPDGTINTQAKSYLRRLMANHLRSLSNGRQTNTDS